MRFTQLAVISIMLAALTACGGGGSDTPPANTTTAEGAYSGTLTGGTTGSNATTLIVTETGDFYALNGTRTNDVLYVSGLVTGKGTSANGAFSAAAKSYYLDTLPSTVNIAANYVQGTSMSGTVTGSTSSGTFSATTAEVLPYVYSQAANISEAVGNWPATGLLGQTGTVTVTADGKITSNQAGCISTGTFTAASGSRNYFKVSITVGPSPCALPGVVINGIAVVSPVENSNLKQLIFAGTTADGSAATVAFGTR